MIEELAVLAIFIVMLVVAVSIAFEDKADAFPQQQSVETKATTAT